MYFTNAVFCVIVIAVIITSSHQNNIDERLGRKIFIVFPGLQAEFSLKVTFWQPLVTVVK